MKTKKNIMERNERRSLLLEEKRAQISERDIPFLKEVETIEQLIKYMHTLKVQHGLIEPEDADVAKQVNSDMYNE